MKLVWSVTSMNCSGSEATISLVIIIEFTYHFLYFESIEKTSFAFLKRVTVLVKAEFAALGALFLVERVFFFEMA